MRLALLLLAPALAAPLGAETLSADAIMRRVAENQDRSVEQRKRFVFRQRARVRVAKGAAKLKRQDTRTYLVAPTPDGFERELVERRVLQRSDGETLEFRGISALSADDVDGIDRELADEFHEELLDDERSRDGVDPDLFPLTSREQKNYRFELLGEERYSNRNVYRIRYEPKGGEWRGEPWQGEVLVDCDKFQPVVVTSQLAWKIPLWARTIFGVNIRQLGFKLTYKELADGVWFPVAYGGEFRVKALHFFRRRVAISLVNSDFQRTEVDSTVRFEP